MLRAINLMLENGKTYSYFSTYSTFLLLYFPTFLLSYFSTFQADTVLELPPIQPVPAPRHSSGILSPLKAFKKPSLPAEPRVEVPGVQRLSPTSPDSA